MTYSIEEHKHRFVAWAASRAASTKTCRFDVMTGKEIIESIGLNRIISSPENLPDADQMDAVHRQWRQSAIRTAERMGLVGFSHGIAAKLINVYLKGAFVCAGHENQHNVAALHPPIDSLLLDELYSNNVGGLKGDWAIARKRRWSKFDSTEYEAVIEAIRKAIPGTALWKIESFWRGYQ